jgi:alkylation response protein AidB-like acyl-CoA dehydrogenase
MIRNTGEVRSGLIDWLETNAGPLAPFRERGAGSIEEAFAHERSLLRMLGEAGWSRYGWPEAVGGLGGTATLRAVLYDELAAAGYVVPEAFNVLETIGPMLCTYAPHLARDEMPAFLAGDRLWCQGFSEPDAGSDLAGLRTRAVEDGDAFRVNGQKTWVSFGHIAQACGLLARTGPPDSRHRGLSILWVDLNLPGVTVRPTRAASGRNEFAEVFFDDVIVPRSALVGGLNQGWAVAMHLLQFERGMYGWLRQAVMHRWLEEAVETVGDGVETSPGSTAAATVGDAYLAALSLRSKCRETVLRLADGQFLGPEISVDKLLLSAGEQTVLDAVRFMAFPSFEIEDTAAAQRGRADWFFSRAASIYGGSAEVQRDIVAEHLLGLPRGRE